MKEKNVILQPAKKNRRKIIRSIIQLVVVIFLAVVLIKAVFLTDKRFAEAVPLNNKDGFIALSYFGVSRNDSSKYVSKKNLEEQLTLLEKQGYQTITQKDILDFYQKNKPLPEKALFLSFEDGRTDSSIFAQNVMEKLNYKATMFTYANKMDTRDHKFLKPKDLKLMEKSGYWELGSNGYRLTYINIFNDKGQSLGMIDENNIPNKTTIEYYNHYLMDFIRNQYMIPSETRQEMEARIKKDYKLMQEIYQQEFGEVPKAYAIMHANSLYNNMDPLVQSVNDKEIKDKFRMHFNLELSAYNDKDSDLYNLNRLQVSPYWSTNHVMMKIKQASNQNIEFKIGDPQLAQKWQTINGAAEFDNNEVTLTSAPSSEGRILLKETMPQQYNVNFTFKGNVVGEQALYVNYDEKTNSYLRIALVDNELVVSEKLPASDIVEKARFPLNEIKWNEEEYAFNKATVYTYQDTQKGSRIVEEEYPRNLTKNRVFNITVNKDKIKVDVDHVLSETIQINPGLHGSQIGFGALFSHKDTSHEQYADDIYDTIIEDILITDRKDQTIFTNQYTNFEKVKHKSTTLFNHVVDFFIETF
ncbi:polysaccharide deacetylase family protein [Lysinibacillus sp. RSDA_15]|uniref:polysaccharide deacetylase family protein n=1 Tax=Lysinibacillus TaxID=400634 RepID=UPI00055DA9F1|nr:MULTISPECIES: polysaccharide deacetylase family protein [Lysinibacillus]MBG9757244.1 polysaccharide deacetylase [Lysinibacillus sphaericus]MBI6862817.1 polysaccharide deacetylase family protein [Lysinibacillus fusiformis]QTB12892.1 polysaccharide deacetylase family protein [Lysinibacillus sphaericus]QTB21797.1 polysaccharide deacetylase family protein [Lysinibacillus sphaericus]